MRARACIAILVSCVIYSGDGGSRWNGGNNEVEAVPAGIQYGPRAARTFAAGHFVQRAVWVDEGSNVAAIETLDPCARTIRRIAF